MSRPLALSFFALGACATGELIMPLEKTQDGASVSVAGTTNGTVLYALSTGGTVRRARVPSLELGRVPVNVAPTTTLSDVAYSSEGAGYFIADGTLLRVLGFENSVAATLDVKVLDPFMVATAGTRVFVATEHDGVVSIDETSMTVAVIDPGVKGPIAASAEHVYFELESKLRRTSSQNGSRDPSFAIDVPPGLRVRTIVRAGESLVIGLEDSAFPHERALHYLTPTGLLQKTSAIANERSPIVADADHAYFCATDQETFGRASRVPLKGGKTQSLSLPGVSDCPFALDETWVYFYGADGLRRIKKTDLPRP